MKYGQIFGLIKFHYEKINPPLNYKDFGRRRGAVIKRIKTKRKQKELI